MATNQSDDGADLQEQPEQPEQPGQPGQSGPMPAPPGTIGGPGTSETDGAPDPRRSSEPVDPILGRPDQPPS